ncbi:uncharacterized protein LOC125496687 [Beta vulgaris subsp. vulgaris]|uniref:uncharacterized protein LOC125496687 n=1 Tax=Beta vulgaris subsp. vulgaris TaxID=3555 RepID=UPI002036B3EA|nr:uncharacterized protein LOC125496687 [Beta vulgaris subsp. vulgaris]
MVGRGIFLIRFNSVESILKACDDGVQFFDQKPLVTRLWDPDMPMEKTNVDIVPIWIKMPGLAIKYWGEKSLFKIASDVGKPVKVYGATKARDKLNYARVMVEVQMMQELPDVIAFCNEHGTEVKQTIEYEWRPTVCRKCYGIGHKEEDCRRGEGRKVWVPKQKKSVDKDGFQLVGDRRVEKTPEVAIVPVHNHFSALLEAEEENQEVQVGKDKMQEGGSCQGPWVVLGDFNAISSVDDRLGSIVRQAEIGPMLECMRICELQDSKASGRFYTWTNKQEGESRVFSRIDRVLVNSPWVDKFDLAEATFLPEGNFDHTPVLFDELSNVVKTEWSKVIHGCPMFRVVEKMKNIKARLQSLKKSGFGDIETEEIVARAELAEAQNELHTDPCNDNLKIKEKLAREKHLKAKKNVYSMLHQKAKLKWLKCGDENTKTFYQSIKTRRMQNRIHAVHTQDGEWVNTTEGVNRAFLDFYQSLFDEKPQQKPVLSTLMAKGKMLTEQHLRILQAQYTREDVKRVIFSIPDEKSPGADGFYSGFFKASWDLIGEEVTEAILDFFKTGKLLKDLVQHYSRKSARACCMLKLDLKKAYDTVNWQFIKQVLEGVGFPNWFVQQIMTCITTPKFSIMVNGSPVGFFRAQRGLRQGDPMSPLLFALGMDYLDRILKFVGDQEGFQFHVKCKEMKISHLCFVDDLLLFCKGEFRSIYTLLQGFEMFSHASGLEVNRNKSEIYYTGMQQNEIQRVTDISGFQKGKLPFRYLGVPISTRKLKAKDCQAMIEKMTSRIRLWSTRHLSFAARSQLINSVLMSMHVYWVQLFILPKSILKEINNICRNFLWTGEHNYAKAGAVKWDKLCHTKATGGLGSGIPTCGT